jgi:hypothetical protein
MEFNYERVPRLILVVGAIGTPVAGFIGGALASAVFALGVLGSWWNYSYLVKAVTTLTSAAAGQTSPSGRIVAGLFLRFLVLGAGAIVILKYSRPSLIPLLVGLLASFIAICLEIVYELLWKSTKSG